MYDKFFNKFISIFLIILFISCSEQITEPYGLKKFIFTLSKPEAKLQTEHLANETIAILLETINKQASVSSNELELIKKNGSYHNFFSDGWYVWQDNISTNPFGEQDAFKASYISKISFNNSNPNLADTTKSFFSVNSKYGFVNNSIYGDEVNFAMKTVLISSSKNVIPIEISAKYKRHWIANYDQTNSDLHFIVSISANNLKYRSHNNKKWFEGYLSISYENYTFDIQFGQNANTKVFFFKRNSLIESYFITLNSLKIMESLSKKNKNIFPGYSSVNRNFINLLGNFPNRDSTYFTSF